MQSAGMQHGFSPAIDQGLDSLGTAQVRGILFVKGKTSCGTAKFLVPLQGDQHLVKDQQGRQTFNILEGSALALCYNNLKHCLPGACS